MPKKRPCRQISPAVSRCVMGIFVLALFLPGSWALGQRPIQPLTEAQQEALAKIEQQILVSGEVRSTEVATVRNEISGQSTIIEMVPDGKEIQKGEILIRLDDTAAREAYQNQRVVVAKAEAELQNVELRLAEAKSSLTSAIQIAEHRLKVAELSKAMKLSEDGELAEAIASSEREIALFEKLPELGNTGEATLRLEAAKAKKRLIKSYLRPLEAARLEKEILESKDAIQTVRSSIQGKIASLEGELETTKLAVNFSKETLDRLEKQLQDCIIHAPESGMIRYVLSSRGSPVAGVGSQVRQGQMLLAIHDTKKLNIHLKVNEVDVNQLRRGQPVSVQVKALGDTLISAKITHVDRASLPTSWLNGNTVYYGVTAELDDLQTNLRPGMSLSGEIMAR